MDPVTLPRYTATLNVQRDDAEGEVIVHGVVTGTAAAVTTAVCSLADAFKDEEER
ncbi:hypothetical protein [Streptomyces sp. WAC 01529]|uniref:hypothetical protein n=1 Tax=Streptomyces sp. WAC 01529 TaxID=2203205 RepID=UPI0013DF041F|nr:hypothetical protein [Streptomyces sp. WAC 01529]